MGRGRFIVFEGLDGSGTTTQVTRLAKWLRKGRRRVIETYEPTDGPIGKILRRVLQGEERMPEEAVAQLFAADRTWHLFHGSDGIEAHLERGAWVLCDRYVFSSLAYQQSDHVESDWLTALNAPAWRMQPDLTFFLDADVSICLRRIDARKGGATLFDDLFHTEDDLYRVFANYRRLLGTGLLTSRLAVIDANRDVDVVFRDLQAVLIQNFPVLASSNSAALRHV